MGMYKNEAREMGLKQQVKKHNIEIVEILLEANVEELRKAR